MIARPTTSNIRKFFLEFIDCAGENKQYQCESLDNENREITPIFEEEKHSLDRLRDVVDVRRR